MLKTRPRISFIHLPKTAGSSLRTMLKDNFLDQEVFNATTILDYVNEDLDTMSVYKLYLGHLFYYRALQILPEDTSYITVLRDPVSRVKSLYYFWRFHGRSYIEDENISEVLRRGPRIAMDLSFLDFLKSNDPFVQQAISNSQFRQLSPIDLRKATTAERDIMVSSAVENLSKFAVVGVQELFNFFIFKLNQTFLTSGFFIDSIKRENRANVRAREEWNQIPNDEKEEIVDLIRKRNDVDYRLYDWAYSKNLQEMNDLVGSKISLPLLYS